MAFTEANERTEAPAPPPAPAPGHESTVIGPGARLDGVVVSAGDLRVEGEVKGEIRADGLVLVAQSSTVEAEVEAKALRIEGRFLGDAEVQGKIELGETAQVQGNLTCGTLVVTEGAVFNGQTTMKTGAPVITLPDVEANGGQGERSEKGSQPAKSQHAEKA